MREAATALRVLTGTMGIADSSDPFWTVPASRPRWRHQDLAPVARPAVLLCPRGDLSVYDTGRGLAIGALTASVKHRSTFFAQSQP